MLLSLWQIACKQKVCRYKTTLQGFYMPLHMSDEYIFTLGSLRNFISGLTNFKPPEILYTWKKKHF